MYHTYYNNFIIIILTNSYYSNREKYFQDYYQSRNLLWSQKILCHSKTSIFQNFTVYFITIFLRIFISNKNFKTIYVIIEKNV